MVAKGPYENSTDKQKVVRVGSTELNQALSPILIGDNSELPYYASSALSASAAYQSILAGAEAAGFDAGDIQAGFFAGLIAAERLAGIQFEFLPRGVQMRLNLRDKWRQIPLDEKGDPAFTSLTDGTPRANDSRAVLNVFTNDEVVEMVNRQLYAQKYQQESHRQKYVAKRQNAPTKPVDGERRGRPKGALNKETTRGEARLLTKIAQAEADVALEREDEAMRAFIATGKISEL